MGTIRANIITDAAGGNTTTINGITPALATQAEAQAGTDDTKLMTPLRVKEATTASLATQAEAQAGTDNTKLMTPLRVEEHTVANNIGWGQTWQTVTRTAGISYQNTTGRPICVVIKSGGSASLIQVSNDNSTWITVDSNDAADYGHATMIIPVNGYYRVTAASAQFFTELR